jgi:hypothetical protein
MLQPVPGGQGYRLDLADEELIALGLQLDGELDRHQRYQKQAQNRLILPKLWGGFEPDVAAGITIEGPELQAYAARVGKTLQSLAERIRREHDGLTCYPLAWVSHHWRAMAAVFADLRRLPRRQVFRLRQHADLVGYQDAAEFNLLGRSANNRPRVRRRRAALANC